MTINKLQYIEAKRVTTYSPLHSSHLSCCYQVHTRRSITVPVLCVCVCVCVTLAYVKVKSEPLRCCRHLDLICWQNQRDIVSYTFLAPFGLCVYTGVHPKEALLFQFSNMCVHTHICITSLWTHKHTSAYTQPAMYAAAYLIT